MNWRRVYIADPQWTLPDYTWGEERKTCMACRHYAEAVGGARRKMEINRVMVCKRSKGSRREYSTCIDARYSGPCGRDAKLFEPERRNRRTRPDEGSERASQAKQQRESVDVE
jgi:hypothetical protein